LELFNLGKVPWLETQLIYHALAELGREALTLVSPATPYVCIGFHQDAEQEVFVRKIIFPYSDETSVGVPYIWTATNSFSI
jgi:lipoate-protein ligase A